MGSMYFGTGVEYSINLHVHFGASTLVSSLSNIRISIIPFITATYGACDTRSWRIHLHNSICILPGRISTLRTLRYQVMNVLSTYVKNEHDDDFNIRCPKIWVDGHGKIVDVRHTGSVGGGNVKNPAKANSVLWSAEKTESSVGAKAPVVPSVDGRARDMYLKWTGI
jgi:hypothetical protein